MKGIVNIIELTITSVILVLAFLHFFPQYSIKTKWNSVLLDIYVQDTLTTIDRIGNTYTFATNTFEFNNFMNRVFSPEYGNQVFVWWKEIDGLPGDYNSKKPYFSEAKKETIIDVVNIGDEFYVYSFTLGLGYPY